MNKKIVIGCDHAGFILKNKIIEFLKEKNYIVEDIGCYNTDSTDYPLIAQQLCKKITSKEYEKGILICGTGIGMSIAANKVKGIRAVVCSDTTSAKFSRQHNNTNVLCFGQRIIGEYLAKDICEIWLDTEFQKERHLKRILMIEDSIDE